MSEQVVLKPKDYKSDIVPVWCPGCGDYAALKSVQIGTFLPLREVLRVSHRPRARRSHGDRSEDGQSGYARVRRRR